VTLDEFGDSNHENAGAGAALRVLHCIPNLTGGGAERQLVYLLEASPSVGLEAHLAITRRGPNFKAAVESGALLYEITDRGSHALNIPLELWHITKKIHPAIIQTWFRQMDIAAGLVALLSRIPWVISERSAALAYPPSIKHRMRLWLGKFAIAVVANSQAGVDYWVEAGRTGRTVMIRNCVPVQRIDSAASISDADVSIDSGAPLLLFAGRLSKEKNLPAFLEMVAAVRRRTSVQAVICGEGPEAAIAKVRVAQLGLETAVRFLGYVENLWSWLKRADVLVSLSDYEGMPNTVLEAMACRCPVVLSDIPAHREVCGPEIAIFGSPRSPASLAERICQLLSDPAERNRRVTAGRKLVEKCSAQAMAGQYGALYRSVSNNARKKCLSRDSE
jgi:glycosyltransferase involved in cell wall biosynthesis